MTDYVSTGTALELQSLGLKDNETDRSERLCLIHADLYFATESGSFYYRINGHNGGLVFAPTSTQLLNKLGSKFQLSYHKGRFYCTGDSVSWFGKTWSHENPAEACASAWIYMKRKNKI